MVNSTIVPQPGDVDVEAGNGPSSPSLFTSEKQPQNSSSDPETIRADAARWHIQPLLLNISVCKMARCYICQLARIDIFVNCLRDLRNGAKI